MPSGKKGNRRVGKYGRKCNAQNKHYQAEDKGKVPSNNEMIRGKWTKNKKRIFRLPSSESQGDFDELAESLAACDLRIKKIVPDGNCMFRAFADQIYGDEERFAGLRSEAMHYLYAHREEYQEFIEDDEPFCRYHARLSKDGEWGGNLELQLLSLVTQFNVIVHQCGETSWQLRNFPLDYPCAQFSFHNGDHYNSVRTSSDSDVEGTPPTKMTLRDILDHRTLDSPVKCEDNKVENDVKRVDDDSDHYASSDRGKQPAKRHEPAPSTKQPESNFPAAERTTTVARRCPITTAANPHRLTERRRPWQSASAAVTSMSLKPDHLTIVNRSNSTPAVSSTWKTFCGMSRSVTDTEDVTSTNPSRSFFQMFTNLIDSHNLCGWIPEPEEEQEQRSKSSNVATAFSSRQPMNRKVRSKLLFDGKQRCDSDDVLYHSAYTNGLAAAHAVRRQTAHGTNASGRELYSRSSLLPQTYSRAAIDTPNGVVLVKSPRISFKMRETRNSYRLDSSEIVSKVGGDTPRKLMNEDDEQLLHTAQSKQPSAAKESQTSSRRREARIRKEQQKREKQRQQKTAAQPTAKHDTKAADENPKTIKKPIRTLSERVIGV